MRNRKFCINTYLLHLLLQQSPSLVMVCSIMVKGPGPYTQSHIWECYTHANCSSVLPGRRLSFPGSGHQGSSLAQHQLDIAFYIYPLQPHEICTRDSYPILPLKTHLGCMHFILLNILPCFNRRCIAGPLSYFVHFILA